MLIVCERTISRPYSIFAILMLSCFSKNLVLFDFVHIAQS